MTSFEKIWCKTISYEISSITKRLEVKNNKYGDDDYYNSIAYQNACRSGNKRFDDLRELNLLIDAYVKLKSLENDNDESQ